MQVFGYTGTASSIRREDVGSRYYKVGEQVGLKRKEEGVFDHILSTHNKYRRLALTL